MRYVVFTSCIIAQHCSTTFFPLMILKSLILNYLLLFCFMIQILMNQLGTYKTCDKTCHVFIDVLLTLPLVTPIYNYILPTSQITSFISIIYKDLCYHSKVTFLRISTIIDKNVKHVCAYSLVHCKASHCLKIRIYELPTFPS